MRVGGSAIRPLSDFLPHKLGGALRRLFSSLQSDTPPDLSRLAACVVAIHQGSEPTVWDDAEQTTPRLVTVMVAGWRDEDGRSDGGAWTVSKVTMTGAL